VELFQFCKFLETACPTKTLQARGSFSISLQGQVRQALSPARVLRVSRFRLLEFCTYLTLLTCVTARAASLSGHVTDAAGRAVPEARISIYARDRQDRITAVTNEQGEYRVDTLGAGEYLVEAGAPGMARSGARPVTLPASGTAATLDLTLDVAAVHTEVLVTATGAAQSTDEVAKSLDSLDAAELSHNAEFSVTESLRPLPGMRIQTLGGPGASTRIMMRGLRPQDTAVTVDGFRFRDAATTQGDATPFLQDLFLADEDRIEVLRGTGSSVYGSNAIGGVINVVTDTGGGPLHGDVQAEGGGLGMMRGAARLGGGSSGGRVNFSLGLQSMDVLNGVDGHDRFRNQTVQGSVQYRPAPSASLSLHAWGADSFAQINTTSYAGTNLPAHGVIQAVPGVNFFPDPNDPDSRRASRFLAGALAWQQQIGRRVAYRVAYSKVITYRRFNDGPAGVRFQPSFTTADLIRGGTDTIEARADIQAARWNVLSVGYEFERESYRSRHLDFAPPPVGMNYFTAAGQRDNTVFFTDQFRLLKDRLQIGLAGRLQQFDLRAPEFAGGISAYRGLTFTAPPRAKTGDISAAFLAAAGTKLRAHTGNGYRSPSIFERFGSSFFDGSFTPLGDPRLRPERTVAFDMGVDQYLFGQKLLLSGTWFYTNLQETILFDSSGFLVAALDPFHRSSGYINTGGGIARGAEFSAEASPSRSLKIRGAYTYTNADTRRSTVRDRDFFQMPFISPHQFSMVATQRFGRRLQVICDVWIASASPAIFSSRAFLFDGPRKVDLVANYTVPVSDRGRLRFYGKVQNVGDSQYLEAGYRVPGRWGIGGVSWEF
jgi:iron complex outermembrane receptor protein